MESENISRVEFRVPVVKNIVSRHSGSVLADNGPIVELTGDVSERIRAAFQSVSEPDKLEISKEKLVEVFLASGLLNRSAHLSKLVTSRFEGSELFNESDCVDAFMKFYAPTFHYGQRLRRYASRGCVSDVCELIIRGCHPNCADGEGLTPLHYACEFNQLDVMVGISDVSGSIVDVNQKDKYGWTPLHTACFHGNQKCAKFLIKLGANINEVNIQGKTALHLSCGQNRHIVCETLLKANCDVTILDSRGMCCLHDAAFYGHKKLFEEIRQAHPSLLEVRDHLGMSPTDYLLREDTTVNTEDDLITPLQIKVSCESPSTIKGLSSSPSVDATLPAPQPAAPPVVEPPVVPATTVTKVKSAKGKPK